MENNKVLTDTVLRNHGIDSVSELVLGIRKDLDLVLFEKCQSLDKETTIYLSNLSERLSSLYSMLYRELCK